MSRTNGPDRTIAHCPSCGSIYAAERGPDGTIEPIGISNGCPCGHTDFVEAEVELETEFDEPEVLDDSA
ncbi:hypothetical protein [Halovivax gelatinilyticus]|uniref:hypothetical protein n=1 Tax=Halovivax gelatinilyticus TaxID=2961597 RepID=UPI0020CA7F3F|nr:hypothetical protein [Halovivax gelatinilyticus]